VNSSGVLDPVSAPPELGLEDSTRVTIYTDGCVLVNPGGPGGWAIVVTEGDDVEEVLVGGVPETTNNMMEMRAVLEALELCDPAQHDLVEVISDSQYVVKGLTEWIHNWKRQNWMRKVKGGAWEEVKNRQMWEKLDAAYDSEFVTVSWIRGHDGDRFNELADVLAGQAARAVRDA
jgi:ribonuclease HI